MRSKNWWDVPSEEEIEAIWAQAVREMSPEYLAEWGHTLDNQWRAAQAVIGGLGKPKNRTNPVAAADSDDSADS